MSQLAARAPTDEEIIEKYKNLEITKPGKERVPFEMGNLHILLRDEGREDRKVRNGATFASTWLDTRNPDWMARDDPKRPQNLHILQKGTPTGPGASYGRTALMHA